MHINNTLFAHSLTKHYKEIDAALCHTRRMLLYFVSCCCCCYSFFSFNVHRVNFWTSLCTHFSDTFGEAILSHDTEDLHWYTLHIFLLFGFFFIFWNDFFFWHIRSFLGNWRCNVGISQLLKLFNLRIFCQWKVVEFCFEK